jgi:hypothetical protein
VLPGGRVNTSQKLLSSAAEPPIATIAQARPPAWAREVASGAVAADGAGAGA